RVEDGVEVGADVQAMEYDVVARVHDGDDVGGGQDVEHARQEASGAHAAGECRQHDPRLIPLPLDRLRVVDFSPHVHQPVAQASGEPGPDLAPLAEALGRLTAPIDELDSAAVRPTHATHDTH